MAYDAKETEGVLLRQRILVPQVLVYLLVIGSFILVGYLMLTRHQQGMIAEKNRAVSAVYRQLINERGEMLTALLEQLVQNEELLVPFAARDREALLQASLPLYRPLFDNHKISHFYFHLPDTTVFLRAHQPNRFGDLVGRETLRIARMTGGFGRGMELGPLGTFTLRVVAPVNRDGELIGYMELGLDTDYLQQQLKGALNVDLVMTIDKGHLRQQDWEEGMKLLGRAADWGQMLDEVVVESTIPDLSPELLFRLTREAFGEASVVEFPLGKSILVGRSLPLADAAGDVVGRLIVLSDFSMERRDAVRTTAMMLVFSLILGGAVLGVGWVILGRAGRRITLARMREQQHVARLDRAKRTLEIEAAERIQAQQELRQANELLEERVEERTAELAAKSALLENIVGNIPSHIYWKDGGLAFLGCNPGFAATLGIRDVSDLNGKRNVDVPLSDEVRALIDDREGRVFASGKGMIDLPLDLQVRGEERSYLHSLLPLAGPDGATLGLLGILKDITERKRAEASLRMSEERFRLTFNSAQTGMVIARPDTVIEQANASFASMLGYGLGELQGKSLSELIHPDNLNDCRVYLGRLLGDGEETSQRGEKRFRHRDGRYLWGAVSIFLVRDPRGNPLHLIIEVEDITSRKEALAQLEANRLLLRQVIDLVPHMIFAKDMDGRFLLANEATAAAYGKTVPEITGALQADLYPDRAEAERYLKNDRKVITGHHKVVHDAEPFLRHDGERRLLQTTKLPLSSAALRTQAVLGVAIDVTEAKEAEEQVKTLAYYDTLTGLPNRTLLLDRLQGVVSLSRREQRKIALFFLDLDRFKYVNDTLGHAAGDRLLQETAQRLKLAVRESDTVARLGGDEFVVLLPAIEPKEAATVVAEKILAKMGEPFILEGKEHYVTTSIGIVLFPDDAEDAGGLLKRADMAMYAAKEAGRNRYRYYSPVMSRHAEERHELAHGLRRALEHGEFFLEYQPQIDAESGTMVGAEALIRWRHPTLGILPPVRFIPLAEETGMIDAMGSWVLQEACRQNRQWQDEGLPPVRMAVNVSGRQVQQGNLVEQVRDALHRSRLDPRWLELEMTESVLIEEREEVIPLLEELKRIGVTLSIDDFGTGYSALTYLKRFPVDRIKIAREFVHEMTTNETDRSLVSALIQLAHSLRMKVLAEGVESQEQLLALRNQHCRDMQGYLFSRPVPPEQIPPLLRKP